MIQRGIHTKTKWFVLLPFLLFAMNWFCIPKKIKKETSEFVSFVHVYKEIRLTGFIYFISILVIYTYF